MKKTQDVRKRGLAPRSLVADEGRRFALESLDRPFASPAAAFVRAALDAPPPEPAAPVAGPAPVAPAVPVTPAPPTATPTISTTTDRMLVRVPISAIDLTRRRFQYRVTRNIARLQESLLLQGQQVPVILRGAPPYEIVSGFGRCEAIALAQSQGKLQDPFVWADVRPALSDREAHEISVIENEDREGLSELDRVNKARRLKDEGYSVAEIAVVLKKRERMVQYYLSLAEAPARISDALVAGKLRPTHALVLTKFAREALAELTPAQIEERLDVLIERCSRGTSVAELRHEIKAGESRPDGPVRPSPFEHLLVPRADGFEFRSFRYSSAMPLDERQRLLDALEHARRLVSKDFEDDVDV